LREAPTLVFDQHVGEEQRKWFRPDQFACAPGCMAKAERLLLAGEACGACRRKIFFQGCEFGIFLPPAQRGFEFELPIEVSSITALLRPVTNMKCSMPAGGPRPPRAG